MFYGVPRGKATQEDWRQGVVRKDRERRKMKMMVLMILTANTCAPLGAFEAVRTQALRNRWHFSPMAGS